MLRIVMLSSVVAAAAVNTVVIKLSPTLPPASAPAATRAAAIMARQIRQRYDTTVVSPAATFSATADVTVTLALNTTIGEEGFAVSDASADGADVLISGGDCGALLFGIGKFLRSSSYDAHFAPGGWRGSSAPQRRGSFRAAYFAT